MDTSQYVINEHRPEIILQKTFKENDGKYNVVSLRLYIINEYNVYRTILSKLNQCLLLDNV